MTTLQDQLSKKQIEAMRAATHPADRIIIRMTPEQPEPQGRGWRKERRETRLTKTQWQK